MAKFVQLNVPNLEPNAAGSRESQVIWVNMDRVVRINRHEGSGGTRAALHMSEGEPKILTVLETPEQVVEAYLKN